MKGVFQHVRQVPNGKTTHVKNTFINVNIPERILSLLSGIFLIYSGFSDSKSNPVSSVIRGLSGCFLFFRGTTGYCPVYAKMETDTSKIENINIKNTFIVNKKRAAVYQFWRKLENLPLFMRHLESVERLDEKNSRWKAKIGKLGTLTWNAEIVEDKDCFIGWQSVAGSDIFNAGKVEFRDAPDGRGTEIQAVISYKAPGGALGTQIGKLLNPVFENYVLQDIRNFKHYFEASETPPN